MDGTVSTGPNSHVFSTAAVWNNNLFFGCSDHNLYNINDSTLAQVWTADVEAEVDGSPILSSPTGLLFVGADDGRVYAVDAANGSKTIVYDTSLDFTYSEYPSIKSSPAAAYGCFFIVAGNDSGRYLYCFGP